MMMIRIMRRGGGQTTTTSKLQLSSRSWSSNLQLITLVLVLACYSSYAQQPEGVIVFEDPDTAAAANENNAASEENVNYYYKENSTEPYGKDVAAGTDNTVVIDNVGDVVPDNSVLFAAVESESITIPNGVVVEAESTTAVANTTNTTTPTNTNTNTTTTTTTTLINHKHNVCDRYQRYINDEVDLALALEGLHLSSMGTPSELLFVDETTGLLDYDNYPGIIPEVMDEIARRGRFEWRDSFEVKDKPDEMTWTEFMEWAAQNYDFAADGWTVSVERLRNGFQFAELLDQNPIIITLKPDERNSIDVWNWTKPFEPWVWLCVAVTLVVSAGIYILLETVGNIREEDQTDRWIVNNMYLSTLMFTGNMIYEPPTLATKVFVVSFSVWSLFITAAYTANLASFLVIRNTPEIQINSLEDVVHNRWPICVWESTSGHLYVENNFPDAILVPIAAKPDMYQAIRDGRCEVAVVPTDLWGLDEMNENINEDCRLIWVGRAITQLSSGFAITMDYNRYCSSLISDVLNLHIIDMSIDGTLETLKNHAKQNAGNAACNVADGGEEEDEDGGGDDVSLDFQSMAGTFFLHGVLSIVAIVIGFVSPQVKKKIKRDGAMTSEEEESDEKNGSRRQVMMYDPENNNDNDSFFSTASGGGDYLQNKSMGRGELVQSGSGVGSFSKSSSNNKSDEKYMRLQRDVDKIYDMLKGMEQHMLNNGSSNNASSKVTWGKSDNSRTTASSDLSYAHVVLK